MLRRRGSSASYQPLEIDDDMPQSIYYTSGTTGTGKGVVRSHGANLAMAMGSAAVAQTASDTWMYCACQCIPPVSMVLPLLPYCRRSTDDAA